MNKEIIPQESDSGASLTSALEREVAYLRRNSWEFRRKPFQILDNIYFVGNTWVSAFLVDSGDGLVLIDSNFDSVVWILLENIRSLGFDPKDIKLMLLTHGHFDHVGGARYIQAVAPDCKTYFPKGDEFMLTQRRELTFQPDMSDFRIDEFYDYDRPIQIGDLSIQPIHTPGHTQGCTSLFFETQFQGKTYRAGIHGGLGNNGLSKKELAADGLPLDTQQRFLASLEAMEKKHVDVFLPSHNSYCDIFTLADQDDGSHSIYIQPEAWPGVMGYRKRLFQELLDSER